MGTGNAEMGRGREGVRCLEIGRGGRNLDGVRVFLVLNIEGMAPDRQPMRILRRGACNWDLTGTL